MKKRTEKGADERRLSTRQLAIIRGDMMMMEVTLLEVIDGMRQSAAKLENLNRKLGELRERLK